MGTNMKKDKEEEEINILNKKIKNCKKCDLFKTKNKNVIGDGSINSKIMLIGEAPGYHEDLQGIPFVGKAGKILDELLKSIGLSRSDIYIANILKCRPPNNRNPTKKEIESCKDFLNQQIEIIKPKVIASLGNYASSFIFNKFGIKYDKISTLHGKKLSIRTLTGEVYIIPLYHPAVATYNPNYKEILLRDFKTIKQIMD
jgi:DNA polymerase